MLVVALNFALALVNAIAAFLKLRCFECGKRLRLRFVKRPSDGATSIECFCCWQLKTEIDNAKAD